MKNGVIAFNCLCLLLESLPGLLRLKLDAKGGLAKEESIAIFQGTFRHEKGKKGKKKKKGGESVAATTSLSNGAAGWARQTFGAFDYLGAVGDDGEGQAG